MSAVLAPPEICVTTIRTLAMDAVQRANSGHPGGPMGLAAVGWSLFTGPLRHSPTNPRWPNRDRFVLSNGHASMLLYSLLHLTGYDLTIDDLKSFRRLHSRTPGHPEYGVTPGVETTTGPLGQGFGNAVGFALAERMMAARYNRPGHDIVDHRTWFTCSDGDLMEGISHEAASLAGFLGLERLAGIYDNNSVSLDGPTSLTYGDDVAGRFGAYGWRVLHVDGNDLEALEGAYAEAQVPDGRPTLIIADTHIGYGAPHMQDTSRAHGSPLGEDEVRATKRAYGWPEDAQFLVPPDVAAWADVMRERGRELEEEWQARLAAYAHAHPDAATELQRVLAGTLPPGWDADVPAFPPGDDKIATRVASFRTMNAIAPRMPEFVQGAADLSESTRTELVDMGDVNRFDYGARNIRYGVREHGMGAITNGLVLHGGLRPVCSTFLQFYDYMKNTVRLAALMGIPSIFVYTHDSVGMGEDGPTHQPIEHLPALRAVPRLVVIRPADANETAAAWRLALERRDGPTVLVLSRQGLPVIEGAADVARGGYVLDDGDDCALIATGSEVSVAREARLLLAAAGVSARVVSLPSFELFAAQPVRYRDSVLPPSMTARVSVEAAATLGWCRWVGDGGAAVGIDRFGESAPGDQVLRELGITAEHVAETARALL